MEIKSSMDDGGTESNSVGNKSVMKVIQTKFSRSIHALRGVLLKTGYFVSSAIILPYCIWVYIFEIDAFSRIPVTLGLLLLSVVTFFLYFTTKIRFRFRFSWRKTFLLALLFMITGISFLAVLSVILFSYLFEAINYTRERRGQKRLSFSPNLGLGIIVALGLVVFPLLNEMYFRGTMSSPLSPLYNKQNYFFEVNKNGFRGPLVPIKRSSTLRILFMGDSTTFGWPYRYKDAYPFMVKKILKARGIDIEIVNAGTVGQSIGQMRRMLPYFLLYKPDIIFLMSGHHSQRADNDFQKSLKEGLSRDTSWRPFLFLPPMLVEIVIFAATTSPIIQSLIKPNTAKAKKALKSLEKHLRVVVKSIKNTGTRLYLVDYPTPAAERRIQNKIRRIAKDTRTHYIPLFDLIGNKIKHHLKDGIHPDPVGHRLIAEQIAKVVANTLKKKRKP